MWSMASCLESWYVATTIKSVENLTMFILTLELLVKVITYVLDIPNSLILLSVDI